MNKPELMICSAQDAVRFVLAHFSDPKTGRPPQTAAPYAVISIQDSGDRNFGFRLTENRFCRDVLTLQFDDIEEAEPGFVLPDEQQAEQIIAFLRKNENAETLLIHCFAGQSRSAAIAKFAAELYGLPAPDCPYCNQYLYSLLCRIHRKYGEKFTECSGI